MSLNNKMGYESPFDKVHKELADSSPFGEQSIFYKPPIRLATQKKISTEKNTWYYLLKQSHKGSNLIEEYQKYNDVLEESTGPTDQETDFIIYHEDNYREGDILIDFGRVLLIKMSKAMIRAFEKPETWLTFSNLSKSIVNQQKDNRYFTATEEDLKQAFREEVECKLDLNGVPFELTVASISNKIFDALSDSLREIKTTRQYWDPSLQSDEYVLEIPVKIADYLDKKLDQFQTVLGKVADRLKDIQLTLQNDSFLNNFIVSCLKIIEFFKKTIQAIQFVLSSLKTVNQHIFAYNCGIIDGLIEFVAGILDIVFLIIKTNIYLEEATAAEIELDALNLREQLEEFFDELIKNPDLISEAIAKSIDNYFYTRYEDNQLTSYQIAHNSGEDAIIAIDLIVSLITFVKGIAKSTQKLPKFNKWIDDVLERDGTGARKLKVRQIKSKYSKIYRIQGGDNLPNYSKSRFKIENNNIIIEGTDRLHITFDDEFRVAQFWIKRGNKANVFVADIDSKFVNKIRREAISQKRGKEFPDRPQIDDPNQTNNSFGIPKNYFNELIESIDNPEILKFEK